MGCFSCTFSALKCSCDALPFAGYSRLLGARDPLDCPDLRRQSHPVRQSMYNLDLFHWDFRVVFFKRTKLGPLKVYHKAAITENELPWWVHLKEDLVSLGHFSSDGVCRLSVHAIILLFIAVAMVPSISFIERPLAVACDMTTPSLEG